MKTRVVQHWIIYFTLRNGSDHWLCIYNMPYCKPSSLGENKFVGLMKIRELSREYPHLEFWMEPATAQ